MDTTTLTLAVDSSQVNNASVALQKMAAEGYKAETVTAKLANTANLQGRALNAGIVKNAAAAADSIKNLTGATTAMAGAQDFSKTTSSLAAAAAQAKAATSEVRAFSNAVASVGTAPSLSFAAPKSSIVQQIAQAPVSIASRSIIGNASQFAGSAPVQSAAAASVRDVSTAARELETKEIAAVNTALGATAAKATEAAKSVSVLDAALARANPADAGIGAISATTRAQQAAIPGAATALGNAVARQNNQAAAAPPVSAETSASIDKYIKQLQQEQAMLGKTAREVELYKLALKGASAEQLKAADTSLKLTEAYQKGEAIGGKIKLGLLAAAAGAVALGAGLVSSVQGAIDAADHLNDLSKKTGIAVDTLGGLGFAASQAGGDLETIAKAAGNLNKSIAQAARGNKEYVATFAAIGVDIRDAAGNIKSTDTVLAEVADKFATYSDGANKSAIATKLMKEAGAGLIGMLNDGGDALRENVDYYKKYAGVTQEVADKSDQFNDTVGKLKLVSGAYSRTLAAELLPALQSIADELLRSKENGDGLIKFIKDLAGGVNDLTASLISGAREAGGFWNAIFIGGTVNPFKSLQSNIASYREELKEANADLERFKREGKDTAPIEASIRRTTARLNIVQGQADREAMANNGPGRQDPRKFDPRLKPAEKPDAPVVPKAGGKGRANNEASQVLREELADDLSAIKAALDAEKAALAFQQKYVQGVYQAGEISLKDFYDSKRETIERGVVAELAELDKEIARLEQYKNQITDPSEKVKTQKQINQVGAQKEKLSTAAARDTVTVNQEEAASFRQLSDQITNYNANLLQMQGDELGAARLRAQVTIDNARILAAQGAKDATGNPVKVDVSALQQAITTANEFADVQRQAGLLAQSTARAEEAAFMVAEQGGKSLAEQENAVYAVRSRALDQLGVLATKARELAEASTDPKIKQFAADLALQYAKAAEAVDPALNRLREAQRNLAAGITNSIDSGVATFAPAYAEQRKAAREEIKAEKDKFDQKINILEGYLATTRDKNDQARLREKIKNLQAQKDSVKGESKGGSVLSTINKSILQPIAGQAMATVNKLLITDPLNEYLKGQFRNLSEGDGVVAKALKGMLGIKDAKVDPKVLAEQAAATATDTLANAVTSQTSAVQASTTALEALANAANSAAGVAGGGNSKPLTVEAGARQAAPSLGDFTRADRALSASQATPEDAAATAALVDARSAVEVMGATSKDAAVTVAAMAQAAGKGGGALGLLPSIVNLFQAAVSAMNVSGAASGGGGGGLLGGIAGLFGSSGGATAASTNASALAPEAADIITSFIFHKGGVVGGSAMSRGTPSSVFANAPRYHTGGIVGQKADGARAALAAAALKHGEVPAILMKNEEVLRRDDPRHRENLGSEVFAKLMQSKGENSASVLQGLLSRLGVKDEDHSRSGVLKVAGARELGGPVSAGKLYRVNEKRPELLNVGNKQYLMMGAQGGSVEPNPGARGQGGHVQHLNVTVAMPQGGNAATAQQFGLIAGRQIQTATRRNG